MKVKIINALKTPSHQFQCYERSTVDKINQSEKYYYRFLHTADFEKSL